MATISQQVLSNIVFVSFLQFNNLARSQTQFYLGCHTITPLSSTELEEVLGSCTCIL